MADMEVGNPMRHAVDPRQKLLFDPVKGMFSPMAIRRMRSDWPGLFRERILHLMPVGKIAKHFHPTQGCPTKELYAMAGAIFLKEFFNLTIDQTVGRYLTDGAWQYGLNVNPTTASLSHASIERYMKLFAEDDTGADVFHRVTTALIAALELDVSAQRLDSTHVFSDMATFGRSKLMAVAIKRFLTQLKRHDRSGYDALPEAFRVRYAPSQSKLFADFTGGRKLLRQTVAEDLLFLVNRFSENAAVSNRTSYQAMGRILEEQCIVSEDKTAVAVKAKTGGAVMQNPSDPDAGYDGHKGVGYQVQIAETCGADNDAQLITGVEVEPAHASDQDAVEPMLDQLAAHDRTPETEYCDTAYGRDENVVEAERRGVDLQSPVAGQQPANGDDLTVDDFVIAETTETSRALPRRLRARLQRTRRRARQYPHGDASVGLWLVCVSFTVPGAAIRRSLRSGSHASAASARLPSCRAGDRCLCRSLSDSLWRRVGQQRVEASHGPGPVADPGSARMALPWGSCCFAGGYVLCNSSRNCSRSSVISG